MTRTSVILVLIDGLGSVFFQENRSRFPYLSDLAERGTLATGVRPAVPGTSRPGRACLLTGRTARDHGVYGNAILDGSGFRPSTADDIGAVTVARLALEAGLDVVGLGFGMLRPEDTRACVQPWWSHMPMGGMTTLKTPKTGDGRTDVILHDPDRRVAEVFADVPFTESAQAADDTRLHAHVIGMASDHRMLRLAGDLACGPRPPDLILTEFDMTDAIAHRHGLESEVTKWAFSQADMAVGLLLHRLERAGRLDDCLVVVCGDHGHGAIDTALYPENLIPDHQWSSEGATLHVRIEDAGRHAALVACLAEHGIRQLDSDHLPEPIADRLATFVAPARTAFEPKPADAPATRISGVPSIVSTHGLDPCDPADQTIAIAHGPHADTMAVRRLEDIAPLVLRGLGVESPIWKGCVAE